MRLRVLARATQGRSHVLALAALSNVVQQFSRPNVQRARDQQNAPHASVTCAELDIGNVVPGHAHAFGELLLRQSAIEAEFRDSLSEEL